MADHISDELLSRALPQYLPRHRWFAGKARTMARVTVTDRVPLPETAISLVFCRVEFTTGPAETYLLPIAVAGDDEGGRVRRDWAEYVIDAAADHVVYDATPRDELWHTLLRLIGEGATLSGEHGTITAAFTPALSSLGGATNVGPLHRHTRQQSHSSAHFGNQLMLKLFRKLAPGLNPELEIGEFLTPVTPRAPAPILAGWLEYRSGDERASAVLLQEFIPNDSDAWTFTLSQLGQYCERAATQPPPSPPAASLADLLRWSNSDPEADVTALVGDWLNTATLLGRRTGELHVALASDAANPDFAPEPFAAADITGLHHAMRATVTRTFALLHQRQSDLPAELQPIAQRVAGLESSILTKLDALPALRPASKRIRVHGDYHLGQVLWTGTNFVIIDFEGEPDRPIAERRIKQSPLKDVAGMLRSFHYASYAGLMGLIPGVTDTAALRPWLQRWYVHTAAAFLRGYRHAAADLWPADPQELTELLELFVLDKLVYELAYELNSRPDWARIPLAGLRELSPS
jgi:trehalose synthase-fused probable maltokinase